MELDSNKILITGSGGFIASHLICKLAESKNCQLKCFVRYNSRNDFGHIDNLPSQISKELEIITGDLRDPSAIVNAAKGVDIIFHLGAMISIPYSYLNPKDAIETNVMGTYNVLCAARDIGVKKIIHTSTSEVYGTAKYVPIDEKHPLQAQSPYSASKISADKIAECFYKSYELPVSIVRPFNTYGPRQSARAIIPTLITQLLEGNKIINLGSLSPTRDFVFVNDTVDGFIKIAESQETIGEEINIATQTEISIGMLANNLIQMINPEAKIICDKARIRPEKSEVNRLLGSNNKIKKLTNWNQNFSLEEGLKETINWFSIPTNLNKYKSTLYNI